MNEEKTKQTAGADERTPSKSQYFSWINNTNEGATEEHTLVNLEYFKWLRDEYGMQLDIYAWDAGNLDGAEGTYQTLLSPKIKAQYPNGYGPVGKAAEAMGTKLGVWCGPDGFGDTPEEGEARRELMVSLCRDHNFGLFKMDAVCSGLREEKQDIFVDMMKECRKYSPELILLNHRLNLGKGMPYATTFLFNGQETYIDVHTANRKSAPHHRQYMFSRGNVPGMLRLTEDHGVCISSCVDYFEDELIYQAFGRSLILAPEIYGNPWLMRDDEHAKLARIYNLHRTYRDILVYGTELPEQYGPCAVARGSGEIRFITSGNDSWDKRSIALNLNSEIGLDRREGEVIVSVHHPYEEYIGSFRYGDRVEVQVDPFRAILIEVAYAEKAYPMLTGCRYEVIHETGGVPDKVKILASSGEIKYIAAGVTFDAPEEISNIPVFDHTVGAPFEIEARWERCDAPTNAEQIFETAQFIMDNDSLERRELRRSGETEIPQVKAARDAFFSQRTYTVKGTESRFAFDGDDNTFYDGVSKTYYGGNIRMEGGCLRVDFGDVYDADAVVIEYFDVERDDLYELKRQVPTVAGHTSTDLGDWQESRLDELIRLRREEHDRIIHQKHNIVKVTGSRKRATYTVNGQVRYFRLSKGYDSISKIALVKDGAELQLKAPKALTLLPSYRDRVLCGYRTCEVELPSELRHGSSYIAIGIDGLKGRESAYAVAELDGRLLGCEDRATSYPSNPWECPVTHSDGSFSYYLDIKPEMLGRKLKLHVLEMNSEAKESRLSVHLCEKNDCREGVVADI